ncbi:Aldo/keto reductase [Trema orientale]|uniref:Aldo/keto reductase n=1 Tax=Trema orientale TaxID=63057 RepID=A0A2P5BDQ3_TREOI|nr:Aldo/keto reductase [Trema orientale]
MEGKKVPEVMLNSGYKMPMIDFVTSHAPIEGHAAIVLWLWLLTTGHMGGLGRVPKKGAWPSRSVSATSAAKSSLKLLKKATIFPAVKQVEMNTSWRQAKLLQFCRDKGIHVTACSPLRAYKDIWGSDAVIENPIL